MIWFDVTKVSGQTHRSGLVRVSGQLRLELAAFLGGGFGEAIWHGRRRVWIDVRTRSVVQLGAGDWLLTPEVFSDEERPGVGAWLARYGARAAAVFHDAIPLRFPGITWPQSVARHPGYMRVLADFGRVFAVSLASARELTGYWAWAGFRPVGTVEAITLGADGHGTPRVAPGPDRTRSKRIVMVGIVEPRKGQEAVLDAVRSLEDEGVAAEVTFVGRVNPHFGRPIVQRIRQLAKQGGRVSFHDSLDDQAVAALIGAARFLVLPSLAEGCGLPVLESLWAGLPVLATALPSIEESAQGGGCLLVPPRDARALAEGMRRMLLDDELIRRLQVEACARPLPRWRETAVTISGRLGASD